jgi:hypothetical protein
MEITHLIQTNTVEMPRYYRLRKENSIKLTPEQIKQLEVVEASKKREERLLKAAEKQAERRKIWQAARRAQLAASALLK